MRSILRSATTEPVLLTHALAVLDAFTAADRPDVALHDLLRVASRLSGRPVGVDDLDGNRLSQEPHAVTPRHTVHTASLRRTIGSRGAPIGTVWMRDAGEDDARRVLILDQLAIAIAIERAGIRLDANLPLRDPAAAVRVLAAPSSTPDERATAARALRIEPDVRVRAVARRQPRAGTAPGARSALDWAFSTAPGPGHVAVALVTEQEAAALDACGVPLGIGRPVTVASFHRSAADAARALAFACPTGRGRNVWRAESLAGLLLLADLAADDLVALPDVQRVDVAIDGAHRLEDLAILEAVGWSPSVRAAARELGYHHSSVCGRLQRISEAAGFPVADSTERLRLQTAVLALRLLGNAEGDLHEGRRAGRADGEPRPAP